MAFFLRPYRQLATLLKVPVILVPRVVIAATAATAIKAAINPYSIAVTPDSSLIRFMKSVRKRFLLRFRKQRTQKMR
jgi:hypothetical protein